ncbi:MAG: hypothetical protein HW421_169 [Ignavibacteria bacterium]|nr:hypothetical protein [Ignavibacteria bacterium]
MKKILICLSLLFFALSLFAQQEQVIKFYLQDGSLKQFKIEDISDLSIANKSDNLLMKIFTNKTSSDVYPVNSVDKIEFSKDSLNNGILSAIIFNNPKSYLISDIDSIVLYYLETKIVSDVSVIDSAKSKELRFADSTKLVFNASSDAAKKLKAGEIIAGEPSKNAPNGFLKRVKSATLSGDSVIVVTEEVKLTDVIENGIISIQKSLTPADTGKGFLRLDKNDKLLSLEPFELTFNQVLFDVDGNSQTTNDQVKVDGFLTVSPELSSSIVIENNKVKYLIIQLSVNNEFKLNANANIGFKKDYQTSLNEILGKPLFEFNFLVWVGVCPICLPIVVSPNVDFKIGYNIDLQGEVTSSISLKNTVTAGIEYNSGDWNKISSVTNNFTYNPPSLSVGGKMKAFLGPQLNVSLYGQEDALNAYANVFGFGELDVDLINKPLWKLYGGVEGNVGVTSKWFDFDKEFPNIFEYKKLLAQANDLITSVTPSEGKAGDIITIKGTAFGDNRGTGYAGFKTGNSLKDITKATEYPKWTNTEIQVKIPVGLPAGNNMLLLNVGGYLSNKADFKIISSTPSITSIVPNKAARGETIIITGDNFGDTRGIGFVLFNGAIAETGDYINWTNKSISIKVPALASTGKVSVTAKGEKSNEVDFIIPPHINTILPVSAKIGDEVTISGYGFDITQGTSIVSFNGTNATQFTSWSQTEIKVKVPAGASSGKISVLVNGNKSNELDFTIIPQITSISPTTAKIGDEISIAGSGFGTSQGNSIVSFGNTNAVNYTSWSDTEIKVIIPGGVTDWKVSVSVNGQKSNEVDFSVLHEITSINPASAKIGDNITITGSGFGSTQGSGFVMFGSVSVTNYISWSATTIVVKVPAGAASGKLSVTINGTKSNEVDFTVLPYISGINPTSASIGDNITITGTGFGATQGTSFVTFNTTNASDYSSWNATSIVVKVPAGATSGNLSVKVNGNKSNEVSFTITTTNPNEVTIGTQIWMTKNLDVTTYRNGDAIPQVTDSAQWANLTTGAWCYYNNDANNGTTYGKLYNWYAVNDPRGLAPTGWHVPSDAEWTTMENYLIANGYNYDGTTSGNKIGKALATANGWQSSTTTGAVGNTDYPAKRNATGFSALPGGWRLNNGTFGRSGLSGLWWSFSESSSLGAWRRNVDYSTVFLTRYSYNKRAGCSVRLVMD